MKKNFKNLQQAFADLKVLFSENWHLINLNNEQFTTAIPCNLSVTKQRINFIACDKNGWLWILTTNYDRSLTIEQMAELACANCKLILEWAGNESWSLWNSGSTLFLPDEDVKPLFERYDVDRDWKSHVRFQLETATKSMFSEFRSGLNQDYLQMMQDMSKKTGGSLAAGCYNFLAGAREDFPNASTPLWRCQAVKVLPLFSPMIRRISALTECIDQGASLFKAVAQQKNVGINTIRSLQGWPLGEGVWISDFDSVIQILDRVKHDQHPKTIEEWNSFLNFARICESFKLSQCSQSTADSVIDQMFKIYGSKIKVGLSADDYSALIHIKDLIQNIWYQVVLPEILSTVDLVEPNVSNKNLEYMNWMREWIYSTISLQKLVQSSKLELNPHINEAGFVNQRKINQPSFVWDQWFEDVVSPENIVIKNLNNQNELEREGNEMNHCVATYGARCFLGEVRILSIQGDGIRSTAAITFDKNNRLYKKEHRSSRNGKPDQHLCDALDWYLKNGAKPLPSLGNIKKQVGYKLTISLKAGYNYEDAERRNVVWQKWQDLLDLKQQTVKEWLLDCTQPNHQPLIDLIEDYKNIDCALKPS